MKKIIPILFFVIGLNYICLAQKPGGIDAEALKVAYITKVLSLSKDEAERFWPVYNGYQDEIRSIIKDMAGRDELEIQEKVLNVRKKYRQDFKKVLVQEDRVNKVYRIEKDFRDILRREWQERKNNRPENFKERRFQKQ